MNSKGKRTAVKTATLGLDSVAGKCLFFIKYGGVILRTYANRVIPIWLCSFCRNG